MMDFALELYLRDYINDLDPNWLNPDLDPNYLHTGVWLGYPTVIVVRPSGNPLESVTAIGTVGGIIVFSASGSLQPYSDIGTLLLSAVSQPPANPAYAMGNVEWPELRFNTQFHQSGSIQGLYWISVESGLGIDDSPLAECYSLTTSKAASTVGQTVYDGSQQLGFHDDHGNTIVNNLFTFNIRFRVWNSLNQFTPNDPAIGVLQAAAITLYYKGIRINCGSQTVLSLGQADRTPIGYFTYIADTAFVGGTAQILNILDNRLEYSRRHGTSFTYTFGAALFSRYYATTRYDFTLFLIDPTATGVGQNVFTVTINGIVTATIDIFAIAGFQNFACQTSFTTTVDSLSLLTMKFDATAGEAMVSGIRILPLPPVDI
jgi:hypothetical protein